MATRATVFNNVRWLYPPLAAGAAVVPFVRLFEDVNVQLTPTTSVHATMGTLFDFASDANGGPAVMALALLVGLIVAALWATARPASFTPPSTIALLSSVLVAMLLTKPGLGEPTPDLTQSGVNAIALGAAALITSVGHLLVLLIVIPFGGEQAEVGKVEAR